MRGIKRIGDRAASGANQPAGCLQSLRTSRAISSGQTSDDDRGVQQRRHRGSTATASQEVDRQQRRASAGNRSSQPRLRKAQQDNAHARNSGKATKAARARYRMPRHAERTSRCGLTWLSADGERSQQRDDKR